MYWSRLLYFIWDLLTHCSVNYHMTLSLYLFSYFQIFAGFGVYLGFMGMYVLLLEYTASKYRAIVNSVTLVLWAVGYLIITITGYLIYRLFKTLR